MKIDHVREACRHHADLTVFGAVITLLEGGTIHTATGAKPASAIIDRCKAAQQRLLKQYDKHRALADAGKGK